MPNRFKVAASSLSVSLVSVLAMAVSAQSVQAQLLEEIVVTAQKRDQALSDVGIAITAYSGDQLEKMGVRSSTDIAAMAPGVFISTDTAGQNRKFTIRGVTQNDFLDAVEAPVAVYVDEGYISTQQGQVFGVFDIERVEILRGPQGTLFGRNATGGLVHYVTRKPSFEDIDGFVRALYGSFDQINVEAAANVPLADNAAVRVSGMYNRHDPLSENQFPLGYFGLDPDPGTRADLQDDDSWALRGHIRFQPSETIDILLSGYGSRTETTSGAYEQQPIIAVFDEMGRHIDTLIASPTETREAIGPGGVAVGIPFLDGEIPGFTEDAMRPVPGGDFFGYRDDDPFDFSISQDFAFDDVNEFKNHGFTANIAWDLSDTITLTSVSDYKSFDKFIALDASGAPASQFIFASQAHTDTFAQELRLNGDGDKLRWVAGGYFLSIDNDTVTGLPFLGDSVLAFSPPPIGLDTNPLDNIPGPGVDLLTEITLETKSYSLFGQVDYQLTETLTLIAGIRVILEDKDYTFVQNSYLNEGDTTLDRGVLGTVITPAIAQSTSEELWTGKLQLEYRPNDDLMIYAGVNRGVKAGSFNGPLPDGAPFSPALIAYDAEVLLAFEAGFKLTFLEGAARLNGSAYYYDYNDYQAFTFTNVSGIITNEDATIKGIEIELITNPIEGLDIMLGASFVDAKISDLEIAPGIFRDVEPSFSPDVQLSGLIRYGWAALGGEAAVQFSANYASSHFYNLRNFTAHQIDSYALGNARVSWTSEDERWEVAAFVNNLWDERYAVENFDLATLSGNSTLRPGNPRWWGGEIRFRF